MMRLERCIHLNCPIWLFQENSFELKWIGISMNSLNQITSSIRPIVPCYRYILFDTECSQMMSVKWHYSHNIKHCSVIWFLHHQIPWLLWGGLFNCLWSFIYIICFLDYFLCLLMCLLFNKLLIAAETILIWICKLTIAHF